MHVDLDKYIKFIQAQCVVLDKVIRISHSRQKRLDLFAGVPLILAGINAGITLIRESVIWRDGSIAPSALYLAIVILLNISLMIAGVAHFVSYVFRFDDKCKDGNEILHDYHYLRHHLQVCKLKGYPVDITNLNHQLDLLADRQSEKLNMPVQHVVVEIV